MSRRVIVPLIVVIVAAGWYVLRERELRPAPPAPIDVAQTPTSAPHPPPLASAPAPSPPPPDHSPEPKPAPVAPKVEQPVDAATLRQPPPDTPVKDVLAMLRSAADQGVPRAACRVGVELIRCGRIGQRMVELESAMAAATNTPKDTQSAQAAMRRATALQLQLATDQRACGGVTEDETREAWRYVYLAAAGGNVAAMSRFARDPGMLGGPNAPEYADAWGAYRRDAPQFRADAIRGGDVRALYYGWWAALNGTSAAGAGVFPPEPETALLYASALRGLVDDRTMRTVDQMTARSASSIDPDRAERLRQDGETLRAQSFANAAPVEIGNDMGKTDVADCWK
jgi:hypothetical protein